MTKKTLSRASPCPIVAQVVRTLRCQCSSDREHSPGPCCLPRGCSPSRQAAGVGDSPVLDGEGEAVTIHIDRHQVRENLFVHFPIPMASAWNNGIFTCSTMLVFQDASPVDAWSRRHALPRGEVRAIQTVYEFARVWYGRHLEEDWRKWTISEAREIFRSFGLEGPIWDLPTVDRGF